MSSRTLTPLISAAILIVITLAVTIPATSSTAPVNQYINKTENLQIIDGIWAPDYSFANITVSNLGTDAVSIKEVQLNGAALSDYVFVSGDSMVAAHESVMIQVSGVFLVNVSYHFCVVTGSGAEFGLVAAPPESSLSSSVESETMEDVTEGVVQVDLVEDVLVDSSSEGDVFVGDDVVDSVVLPENLVNPFWPYVDPSTIYALNMQAEQYLADVAARKALLLNYSSIQNPQENDETGQVWEPLDVQVSFHVRLMGGYWEAVQDEGLDVVFGGYDCAGGVNGGDGGAVLNAAIDAASVAGGGRVTVGCGVLLADCIVPKSGVELCGEGETSVLRQNADANTIFIHSPEKIVNFSLHDLAIDYNHHSQSSPKEGMYIGHASEYLHFYNLWIRNCKKFGIHLASLNQPNAPPISCKNVKVEDIVFSDVVTENWDLCVVAAHGGSIRNVTIYGMHRNGGIVAFEGTNLLVTDCTVTIDRQDGEIVGGIWLGSCNYSICANNTVIGQTMHGIYETIGIRVNTEHDNMKPRDSYKKLVIGNCVSNIRHGIMLEETSDDYVAFNALFDCANGIAFPSYGYPAPIDSKILFNSLNNVACPIREFIAPVDMQQFFNNARYS